MKKIMINMCIVFALISLSASAQDDNMPKPGGDYVPGYHDFDVPGQSYSQSSQNISGTYYSDDIRMSDMPTGKGYWVLVLSSNKSFTLKRCCDSNSSLVKERYSGEYKYIYGNGEGAGSLWSNGNRIGTFITTSTGIRLGTIDMKKR